MVILPRAGNVELFLYFVDKATNNLISKVGTGTLVGETLVLTAGHCVYDRQLHRLVRAEAYLGYSDKGHADVRCGQLVAFPSTYIDGDEDEDLAVIRLEKPFQEDVRPWELIYTPDQTKLKEIIVVGYPMD
ncbi:uncharacterized protein PAC_14151 [Phialocephala subalpina]|uniref:Peptidase S1 domain-containing protein n=1 Tax=Phialocephala subalpina TaxID=576137 RepID=A0A1L7XGT6_9HELO|nr:uncharacterized protein PAC_14151 [Phialocephala subalpina]